MANRLRDELPASADKDAAPLGAPTIAGPPVEKVAPPAPYEKFAAELIAQVVGRNEALEKSISPCLDRSLASLSPVERVILLIGAYELAERPETPFKVVLNEAIELGKSFGGTDGHKFVNGVLDRLAADLRAPEIRALAAERDASAAG